MANKRINTSEKGSRIELEAVKELRTAGFITWKTARVKFQSLELFHLFDICGLAKDGSVMLLIQVKSHKLYGCKRAQIAALLVPCGVEKWIWVREAGGGFSKERIH